MLLLAQRPGERVYIGNDIVVTVVDVRGGSARLGFQCPDQISVHREEVHRRIHEEQRAKAPIQLPEPWDKCVDLG
jgi:carbon storage regulator